MVFFCDYRWSDFLGVLEYIVLPNALLYPTIGIGAGGLSIRFAVLTFTDVFVAIGTGIGALSVPFAIPEFTDVFAAIGRGISAKAVIVILVLA